MLVAVGYTPLTPASALALRGGKRRNVVLDEVLERRILALNSVRHRGREFPLDITDAREAIRKLIDQGNLSGLTAINQKVYDDLVRGVSVSKTIDGTSVSPHVRFIDWNDPSRNEYHVTVEFAVEKTGSSTVDRLDVVGFVNGIPFVAMECKEPGEPIATADRQLLRYQRPKDIPGFFHFAQLLLAGNGSAAEYATVQTPKRFWSAWRHTQDEPDFTAEAASVAAAVRSPLPADVASDLFGAVPLDLDALAARTPGQQDATLFALARPERLLELVRVFTVFDAGSRKIARHQQYFAVKRAIEQVTSGVPGDRRPGGLIWHTQGSGKSLTMVMLAKALEYEPSIVDPRVVLVTDRDDLDVQIRDTFRSCGLDPIRARSGRHLADLIRDRAALITTVINKFENAAKQLESDPAPPDANVFVLVDEGHRTHSARLGDFGQFAKKMRRSLPLANFIAFTGTPLMTRERNSFRTFGDLIHRYTIKDANDDHAVVPLLYEGRYVEKQITEGVIDAWFERISAPLSPEQRRDLKRKFSGERALTASEQVIRAKAYDVSMHYRLHWQGTGLKAQLIAPDKASAIRFKAELDEIGDVTSEVIISAPGDDTDAEAGDRESREVVQRFWAQTMTRFGTETAYNQQVIDAFKGPGAPEILIVVSKLLTGFDAPRNTVLYICRPLRDHTLLQAIARVNRLYDPPTAQDPTKDFGVIIDYEGLLRELDEALDKYGDALGDFDPGDIAGAVASVREEIARLDGRWSAVWALFDGLRRDDREAQEQRLEPDDLRDEFTARLAAFSQTLHIALSSELVDDVVTPERLDRYKSDWAWFVTLRRAAQFRYNDRVDLRDYEPKIRRLLDDHLTALPAVEHIPALDLSDPAAVSAAAEDERATPAARADRIAHATRRRITEQMDEDPALFERFSRLLQDAIEAHRAHRLDELHYLAEVRRLAEAVEQGRPSERGDLPEIVRRNPHAASVFEAIGRRFTMAAGGSPATGEEVAAIASGLIDIVQSHLVVGIWDDNRTALNGLETAIDLYLWDVVETSMGLTLTGDDEESIRTEVLRIARARFA
jgi:type I restriction enzyme R subunit